MTTFSEYSVRWEQTILPLSKPATIATVRSHLSKLTCAFGDLPIDLPYRTVQEYFTLQSKTLAPKTVRNIFSSLHLVLSSAMREGLIAKVPQITLPKAGKRELGWLSVDDMKRIIAGSRPTHTPFYALLAETGLRIGEALGLQKWDINGPNGTLVVRRSVYNGRPQAPKTSSAFRTLTISPTLCNLLQSIETPEEGFLFHTSSGKPWWPDKAAAGDLGQLFKDLKINPVGFHGFRRGNATLLCSVLGCPEKIAAYRLGHAAQGLTLGLYAQSFSGMDREWVPKIEKALYGK
jgi:integrase